MTGARLSTFVLYILLTILFFPNRQLDAAEDIELQGHLERIQYYEMALEDQSNALNMCTDNISGTLKAYDAAVAEGDSDLAASKNSEYLSLENLRNHYLNKILDTLQKLASEHAQAASKLQEMRLHNDALEQTSKAGELLDRRAEIYSQQASNALQESQYDKAGPRYEQAYSAYRSAEAQWQRALQLYKLINAEHDAKELRRRRESSFLKGSAVLRSAANAYFNSYQLHKEKASAQNVDIYSRNAGDEWRLTAQAQQNYERVQKVLKLLDKQ